MEKIPVHNPNAMAMYVHGTMIPPGETRHFGKVDLPPQYWPQAEEEAPQDAGQTDAVAALCDLSVAKLVAALPGLTDADLERLGDIEQAKGDNARKTALSAIAEELLKRGAAAQDNAAMVALAEGEESDIINSLPVLNDEHLLALQGIEQGKGEAARLALLDAIVAEMAARSGAQ